MHQSNYHYKQWHLSPATSALVNQTKRLHQTLAIVLGDMRAGFELGIPEPSVSLGNERVRQWDIMTCEGLDNARNICDRLARLRCNILVG